MITAAVIFVWGIINLRPLQKAIICSNSRPEKNLIPQLPFGNEDVKFFDNEEIGQRIVFTHPFILFCNGLNFFYHKRKIIKCRKNIGKFKGEIFES